MKLRIAITVLVLLMNRFLLFAYDMIKSPVTGSANAQQLSDTLSGYATSRFFAVNGVESVICAATIFSILFIWGSLLCKSKPANGCCGKVNTQ